MIGENKINKMEACWEAITLNDWRMLNNEILKKILAFPQREQLKRLCFGPLTMVLNFKR